jgi:hypothetical protein
MENHRWYDFDGPTWRVALERQRIDMHVGPRRERVPNFFATPWRP